MHGGREAEADAVFAFEVAGQGSDGLPGVDADFAGAPETAFEVFLLYGLTASVYAGHVEQLDIVAEVRGQGGEFG